MKRLMKRLAGWILRKEIRQWRAKFDEQEEMLELMSESSSQLLKAHTKLVKTLRGDSDDVPVKRTIH